MVAPLFVTLAVSPLAAQESAGQSEVQGTPEETVVLDLTLPQTKPSAELDEQCEAQMDAARLAGEIVVCRSLGEATDGSWNAAEFEREYAQRTLGPKNPDVDGTGLILPTEGSVFTVTVTVKMGDPPAPALMIDVGALPEPPPGSDADRIARGLPPLGED